MLSILTKTKNYESNGIKDGKMELKLVISKGKSTLA